MNLLERFGLQRKASLPVVAREEMGVVALASSQTRRSYQLGSPVLANPFLIVPQHQNLVLYEQFAKTIPILPAAMRRITELVGCPKAASEDQDATDEVNEWWENVQVNQIQQGGANWFAGHVFDHQLYGRAHAELIPTADRTDIGAIQELHTRTIDLRPKAVAYGVEIVQRLALGGFPKVLNPALILTSVHDIQGDSPQGNSLIGGLEFVSEIYEKILIATRGVWNRFGQPSYWLNFEPPEKWDDPLGIRGAAINANQAAMMDNIEQARANGDIKNFSTVGKVTVQILGANGETLDIEVPGRHILEQICAATGLPPWMFGYHWSTTERLSRDQAIILGERIDSVREHLEAPLLYLFRLRQALVGRPFTEKCMLEWEAPSLMDATEEAKGDLLRAQADGAKLKILEREWTLGIVSNIDVAREMRGDLEGMTDAEVLAKLPDLLAAPPAPPANPLAASGDPASQEDVPPQSSNNPPGKSLSYGDAWSISNGNGRKSVR